ncbi:MAG: hypothetical protein M1423_00635, partial [Acidobacteria bacterium]|nr:hypothetical protein [Acidobacteriota bacterium]
PETISRPAAADSGPRESRLTSEEEPKKGVHPRGMCGIEILVKIFDAHPEGERWDKAYRN